LISIRFHYGIGRRGRVVFLVVEESTTSKYRDLSTSLRFGRDDVAIRLG
jgi:hypothetical protein